MNKILFAAISLLLLGCDKEGRFSFLKQDSVTITSDPIYLPSDFFDPIPAAVDSTPSYHFAQPVCSSNCEINIPGGPSLNINDLGTYFNLFDGTIRITAIDYTKNPTSVEHVPLKIVPIAPGGDGGRNPSRENISVSENPFGEFSILGSFGNQFDGYLGGGSSDFEIPQLPPDTTVTDSIAQAAASQAAEAMRRAKDDAAFDRSIAEMKAQAQAPFTEILAGMIASFAPTEMALHKRMSDAAKTSREKSDKASQEAKQAIDNSQFDDLRSEIDGLIKSERNASETTAREIAQKLPEPNIEVTRSKFKTSPHTLEGRDLQIASDYLDFAKRTVEKSPAGEGRNAANQLIIDGNIILTSSDEYYATGRSELAEASLRITYQLADAAIALAPIVVLATAPASLTTFAVVSALAVGKSWYEARTGKRIWNGEPLTVMQRQMAYIDVGFSMLPALGALAEAGGRGLTTIAEALSGPFVKGALPTEQKVAAEIAENSTKILTRAKSLGFGTKEEASTVAQSLKPSLESDSSYTLYPRGPGASTGPVPEGYTQVSRWIGDSEVKLWYEGGGTRIPPTISEATGRVYVTLPGAGIAGEGGLNRVDFSVPSSMLKPAGGESWRQIFQPAANTPIYNVTINLN